MSPIKKNKKTAGFLIFAAMFLLYRFLPPIGGMETETVHAMIYLLLCVTMWLTEFIPLGVSALLALALAPVMGLGSLKETLAPFANPTVFFVIATFSFSAALTKVPIAKRILFLMLKTMGSSVNRFLFAVMGATFLISSIMSNIPATAAFIPISLSLLELYDREEDKRKTGRAFMIALAVAGMIGGIITPAGSSNNLISLSLLEEYDKSTVRFLDWIIICAPIALAVLPLAWLFIVWVFKPVEVEKERIERYLLKLEELPKPGGKEYIIALVTLVTVGVWILSTWFPALDVTVVAIVGMVVLFLPGISVFDWEAFVSEVSWEAVLSMGSVLCVGSIVSRSGVAEVMARTLFQITPGMSPAMLILKLALFISVMQLVIPSGPAVVTTTTLPVILAAQSIGLTPAMLTIPLCILSSLTIIIPLSAVPLITYSTGYYKITDIGKVGVPVLAVITLIMMAWVPFIINLLYG